MEDKDNSAVAVKNGEESAGVFGAFLPSFAGGAAHTTTIRCSWYFARYLCIPVSMHTPFLLHNIPSLILVNV